MKGGRKSAGSGVLSYLKSADESIVDLVMEELRSVVVDAGPSPHVLVVAVVASELQDASRRRPHEHGEDEIAACEERVVHANFLSSRVTAAAVADEDEDAG